MSIDDTSQPCFALLGELVEHVFDRAERGSGDGGGGAVARSRAAEDVLACQAVDATADQLMHELVAQRLAQLVDVVMAS